VPEFFSALIWSQRVRELESSTKHDTDGLAQLATLVSRAEKRSQWLRKQYRTNRRKTVDAEQELVLARCYLAAAEIREYVASWVKQRATDGRAGHSVPELEANVARMFGAMLAIVEQLLKTRDDGAYDLHAVPLSAPFLEPPDENPDDAGEPEL
jgi:hypothetical protein